MLLRKLLATVVAALFLTVTAISPILADGNPAGGTSNDGSVHPWDVNDGLPTGGGTGDQVAPTLSVLLFWYGPLGDLIGTAVTASSLSKSVSATKPTTAPSTSTDSLKRSKVRSSKVEY